MSDITDRLSAANELLKAIGREGPQFFYCDVNERFSSFTVFREKVLFTDDYTGVQFEVKSGGKWKGFSHGGTLRELVVMIADYILTGKQIPMGYIGLERHDGSYIWGYCAEDIAKVREKAALTGVMLEEEA